MELRPVRNWQVFYRMKETVVVALSGGVDSSAAAVLALRAGREVVGATLRLRHPDPAFAASRFCASEEDERAVEQLCSQLGIRHVCLDRFPEFSERVLRPAALAYSTGLTPNPCCECNPAVKFGELLRFADEIGAAKLLTGHYASIESDGERLRIRRGADPVKDQSYFLFRLTQKELARIEFPVGGLAKSEVRALAAEYGLATSRKPDSQDACFLIPGECFGETLRRLCALPERPGRFLYRGRTVGRHNGIHRYTIGQRKGLNVALGVPAYISRIDPESGDITLVTDPAELECRSFRVDRINWQYRMPHPGEMVEVQIRYRSAPVPARVELLPDHTAAVFPDHPLRAVTPGQAAVFYLGPILLGGGTIRYAD